MASANALRFSTFDVTRQVFFTSKLSFGIVNLKPIVDNHVLVIPRRLAPRVSDLTPEEMSDLFQSVQTIGKTIEKATNAKSLTIACQDGPYADFEPIDGIYDKLDSVDIATDFHTIRDRAQTAKAKLKMDSERQPRTDEDMAKEAAWLASLFRTTTSQ